MDTEKAKKIAEAIKREMLLDVGRAVIRNNKARSDIRKMLRGKNTVLLVKSLSGN